MEKRGFPSSIVECNGVCLHYTTHHDALKEIQFKLNPGDFYFLSGESGAGKTSLLKLMYMDRLPTRGRVRLFGQAVDMLSRNARAKLRRQIGVVFQDFRLLNHLSAFENVALPLRITDTPEAEIKKHVSEMLSWVGLEKKMHVLPEELSGGEKQRIAIARAVINRPLLLLADEPTGNVDEEMAAKLLYLFLELNKMGTTVVIATHSQRLINQFDFPQIYLEKGQMTIKETRKTKVEMAQKLFRKDW